MRSLLAEPEGQLDRANFSQLYIHYEDVPDEIWRWRNFTAEEIACPKTGQCYVESRSLDCLQSARDLVGRAFHLNSCHRSRVHNAQVRGAARSRHLLLAFDVSTRNHERAELYIALRSAGFGSFGFYNQFIHADIRPGRRWWSSHATKRMWREALRSAA